MLRPRLLLRVLVCGLVFVLSGLPFASGQVGTKVPGAAPKANRKPASLEEAQIAALEKEMQARAKAAKIPRAQADQAWYALAVLNKTSGTIKWSYHKAQGPHPAAETLAQMLKQGWSKYFIEVYKTEVAVDLRINQLINQGHMGGFK